MVVLFMPAEEAMVGDTTMDTNVEPIGWSVEGDGGLVEV